MGIAVHVRHIMCYRNKRFLTLGTFFHLLTSTSNMASQPHQQPQPSKSLLQSPRHDPLTPHQATSMTPHWPLQSSGKKNKRYKDVSDDDSTMMSPAQKRRRCKSIAPSFFLIA
jgi:hypothetical protein